MFDLNAVGWFLVGLCAFLVGVSKTGLPGLGILIVPLMAMALPQHARESTGIMLGMLILGDLFAATYYRRIAEWKHVLRLLPPAFLGIVAGWGAMQFVTNEQLKRLIGVIVLGMLALHLWRTRSAEGAIPTQWWFAAILGFLAGVTTMMANAAGPVMVIYLLAMRLPKLAFVGTSAWFFFVVNWLKVPFSAQLDLTTGASVKLGLLMLPLIIVGSLAGIFFLRRIPQKAFNGLIQLLAAAAALKLLF